MTTGFGALQVELSADATKFTAQLKNAEGALSSSQARMNRALGAIEKGWKSLATPLKGVLGQVFSLKTAFAALLGAGGVAGLGKLTKDAIANADAIAKMADRIGVSTDALQQLTYVASQSGIPIEQMEVGLRKLNQVLADQAAGKKTVLQQVGIDALDAAGKVRPLEEVLLDLADVFKEIGPQSAAGIRVLTLALGERSGTAFASALKDGSGAIRQMMDDAKRLGLVLEADLLRGAESAGDALDRMKDIVGANLTRVLLQLSPTLERVAKAFADGAPGIERFANGLIKLAFGVEALSARGLAHEVEKANAEWKRQLELVEQLESKLPELQRAADAEQNSATRRALSNIFPGGARSALAEAQADLDKLKQKAGDAGAEVQRLQQLLNEAQTAETAAQNLPTAPAALPSGMVDRKAERDALASFLESQREAILLAGAETEKRAALQAVLRAEAAARQDGRTLTDEEREAVIRHANEIERLTEKERSRTEAMAEGKALTESLRTPSEVYADTLERINELLAKNYISEQDAARAREQAKETFETADEGAKQAKAATDQLALSFKSAFEEAVFGGGDLKDVFVGLIEDIARMILQLYILKPLLDAIAKSFESILGGGGGGGFLGSIFGGIFGGSSGNLGFTGGSGQSWTNFASGGSFRVGGSGGTDSQFVGFNATPGEMVDIRTPGQDRGGAVTVNVINNSGEKTQTREGTGPNGERLLEIVIGKVEQGLRTPGSRLHSAMSQTFGAKTVLGTR